MYHVIKKLWNESSDDLSGTDAFWERSALGYSLLVDFKKVLTPANIHGRLLDAGAGKLSYRHLVKPLISEYVSMDFKPSHPDLDYEADIQNMPLPDNSFDTVLSAEVLEHVPDPAKALSEIYRVLKPGGHLVMSVPHLMYLHNEPHDFFRYTNYGLRTILEKAGFTIITLQSSGSIFSFIQGILATTFVGLTYNIPIIWPIVFTISKITGQISIWLDNKLDKKKIFALHFIAVAQK
jgi:SAM-dependent methyltransferase